MPFLAPVLPAIISAGSSIAGGLLGGGKSGGEKNLENLLAQRQSMLMPAGQAAIDYYTKLLSGDRTATATALSPSIQALTDQYDTAAKNLGASLPPGGVRDLAMARLQMGKTRDIANLFSASQGTAAGALASLFSGAGVADVSGAQTLANLGAGRAAGNVAMGQQIGGQIGDILGSILFPKKSEAKTPQPSNAPFLGSFSLGY